MVAYVGSLGTVKDARSALETACSMAPGHDWDPAEALGRELWPESFGRVAAHPKCKECVDQMKARLYERGLLEEQVVRALRRLGVSISVRKEYERKTFSEEDTIMLGGKYTDWLYGRPVGGTSRPVKKLGDSIEWVEVLTPEMVMHNRDRQEEEERVAVLRMEAVDAGASLEEAARLYPMPDSVTFMEKPKEEW